jgi:hypothetical protein
MAYTVDQCISQCKLHMSDFPLDTDPNALLLANLAQSDIVRAVALYPNTTWNITLVAGQQEYALDPSIIHITSAIWQWNNGVTSQVTLIPTSIDQLDYEYPNWRAMSPATTYKYYEYGGMLGLVPPPSQSTSGGYPTVILNTQVEQPFASTASTLPSQVPTTDPWVWGMCARWAAMQRRDDAAGFADLALSARNDLIKFVNGRLLRQKSQLRQSYSRVRNV